MTALPQSVYTATRHDEAWPELDLCEALLAQHLDAAVRTLGSAALGLVDLPPLSEAAPSPEQIKVAAVLLWAREVEATGLLRFTEALAEGVVRGRLLLPIRGAGSRLMRYHRGRTERFTADERKAIYSRIFGGPGSTHPNSEFAQTFDGLVTALDELGRAPNTRGTTHLLVRIQTLANVLTRSLSARAVGISAFAARDIVAHVREALTILRDPELVAALGAGGVWRIITIHAPLVLGAEVEIDSHLTRASAGLALLSWLAASARQLSGGSPSPAVAQAVQAAARWRAGRRGV